MNQFFYKTLFVVSVMASALTAFGQKCSNPIYYLNSSKVDIEKLFINPRNIDSVSVEKETEYGEVYLFTKHRAINFLSLDDVLKKHSCVIKPDKSTLFRVNGVIISDLSGIRFDDTYFIYVDSKPLSDVKYLDDKFKNLIEVDICLDTIEHKPSILLKGNLEILPGDFIGYKRK